MAERPNLFMLDSGAYSVWSRGESLELQEYIDFCLAHPEVDYYVNLDKIIGVKGDERSKTPEAVAAASKESWNNYLTMIRVIPEEKVIPVFHRGDSFDWLERYMDFGCKYIGIGQSGQGNLESRTRWLNRLKTFILGADGRPIVKTHGFAVTSMEMMKYLPWHSVDSSSWIQGGSYGMVYAPKQRNQQFVFDVEPFILAFSPKSTYLDKKNSHFDNLPPTLKEMYLGYVKDHLKMSMGSYELEEVAADYKLQDNELWWDKKKIKMIVTERGLKTDHQQRFWANMKFFQNANEVIDVDHIYFAGAEGSLLEPIEFRTGRRLMSYFMMRQSKRARVMLEKHMERKRERQAV